MPNKSLGQHFLNDRNILNIIADTAKIEPHDPVVEIGPGRGSLTRVLSARTAHLTAIEIDPMLVDYLREEFPSSVRILNSDARKIDPATLLNESQQYTLVGNLPYYAALPILRRFLESSHPPKRIVVLVQREVAKQLCAQPGSMSLSSVTFQLYGHLRIVRNVRPGSFSPPPKVTSSIVSFETTFDHLKKIHNKDNFFTIVKAGFSAPRKQLSNSIAGGLGLQNSEVTKILGDTGIDPTRRAQTMSIDEWISLYANVYQE